MWSANARATTQHWCGLLGLPYTAFRRATPVSKSETSRRDIAVGAVSPEAALIVETNILLTTARADFASLQRGQRSPTRAFLWP